MLNKSYSSAAKWHSFTTENYHKVTDPFSDSVTVFALALPFKTDLLSYLPCMVMTDEVYVTGPPSIDKLGSGSMKSFLCTWLFVTLAHTHTVTPEIVGHPNGVHT